MIPALLCHSGYSAVNAAVKAELFPAHVRARGVALPYAIANALFGGTAEYVAEWLKGAKIESLVSMSMSRSSCWLRCCRRRATSQHQHRKPDPG